MKSLSFEQLEVYSQYIFEKLSLAQLQELWTDGYIVVLEFYKFRNFWLCFDLDQNSPRVVLLEKKPPIMKKPKPITTFLASKARNFRLTDILTEESLGRVMTLVLESSSSKVQLQAILIPRSVNLIAEAQDKSVSWNRPKDLPLSTFSDPNKTHWTPEMVKGFAQEWAQFFWEMRFEKSRSKGVGGSGSPLDELKKNIQRSIEKKQKALAALGEQVLQDTESQWREFGEHLKVSEVVPEKYLSLQDATQSLSWNLQNAFKKAKEIERKKMGTLERIEILKREILELERKLASDISLAEVGSEKRSQAALLMKKSNMHGRRRSFAGEIEAVIGKSAKDNLNLLRSARAWDYWIHLRDYPSAHAILFRKKDQVVPDAVLQEVAQWIISESLGAKQFPSGTRYDLLIAECRFVRPIKGSPGLVTYQNQKIFTFASR